MSHENEIKKAAERAIEMGSGMLQIKAIDLDDPIDIPDFIRRTPDSILVEAEAIVKQREPDYGSASEGFGRTAAMWSAYLGITITAKECAAMFAINKLSREKGKHKRDNLVDLAGYAEVMRRIEAGE